MSESKKTRRKLRIVSAYDAVLQQGASVSDESVSQSLVVSDRREFVLGEQAWASFNATLDRPAEARSRVVELLRRPRPE